MIIWMSDYKKKKGQPMREPEQGDFGFDVPIQVNGDDPPWYNHIEHRRNSDPDTSDMAARSAKGLAGKHCLLIKNLLVSVSPMSLNYEEISGRLGFDNQNKVARRMVDLERQGLVERTNETRATKSGRQAQLWKAVV